MMEIIDQLRVQVAYMEERLKRLENIAYKEAVEKEDAERAKQAGKTDTDAV